MTAPSVLVVPHAELAYRPRSTTLELRAVFAVSDPGQAKRLDLIMAAIEQALAGYDPQPKVTHKFVTT